MNDKNTGKKFKMLGIIVIVIVIMSGAVAGGKMIISNSQGEEPEIITKSTLEKIINVSDLSTCESVYNGVAKVMNEEKEDKIDYYVSYEAKVKAGFDTEKVELDVDRERKVITVTMPKIRITATDVDVASLDYIFMNDKANTSTVTGQAYKKCLEDVENKSSSEDAIYRLAGENAKDVMTALIHPFIEQLDDDYELTVKIEGEEENEKNN